VVIAEVRKTFVMKKKPDVLVIVVLLFGLGVLVSGYTQSMTNDASAQVGVNSAHYQFK